MCCTVCTAVGAGGRRSCVWGRQTSSVKCRPTRMRCRNGAPRRMKEAPTASERTLLAAGRSNLVSPDSARVMIWSCGFSYAFQTPGPILATNPATNPCNPSHAPQAPHSNVRTRDPDAHRWLSGCQREHCSWCWNEAKRPAVISWKCELASPTRSLHLGWHL